MNLQAMRQETWIAVVSFCTSDGARLTYQNRSHPELRCFEGTFIFIDFYRPSVISNPINTKEYCDYRPKERFVYTQTKEKESRSVWTPECAHVPIVKKKRRCKAARKAKENNAFRMWNPLEYKYDKKRKKGRKKPKREGRKDIALTKADKNVLPERDLPQETSVKQQYALRAGGSGDCKISSSEITFGKVIGEGGKSTVHEGLLKRGAESIPVALKKYRVSRMSSRCKKQVESEAENLSKLQHPNVIKYYGTCLDQKTIVMEQMGLTLNDDMECKVNNVREYLDECVDEAIESSVRVKIALDAAKGLQHLHQNGIVHRDVKSSNLLVKLENKLLTVKIGDFGEARKQIEQGLTSIDTLGSKRLVGTIPYMSPEACNCEPLDKANDVYAFGMVMYELCNTKCRFPWDEEITSVHLSIESIKQYVTKGERPKLPTEQEHGMPKRFLELMQKCWSQDPKARPVITDIVQELEDISNAECNEAVQGEASRSSNMVSKLCDNFHIEHLSVHQGYVLEIAGERTADAMRKHKKIPEVTMEEIDNLVKERDASNACVFLGLSTALKTIEVMGAAEAMQNIHDTLECLKSITEGAILNLPKEINGYRELDSHYSVMEAIDVMRKAGIITCDIDAFEMLPDNPSLKDAQQEHLHNAVLRLMESDKSEAAIYVCPPLAITLIKLSKSSNQGYISIVDTHSVPKDLGGNGNGIVISTDYDGITKGSKCSLVCDWLRKRTLLYGIPGETRQTLININENKEFLTELEWGDWNDGNIDELLLLSEQMLPSNNKEVKRDAATMSSNTMNVTTSKVIDEKAESPVTEFSKINEKNTKEVKETLWRGYATQLGVTHLKPFQIEAINAFVKGKDCLIVQPTGSGKSVCFQVPALMNKERFVLVISPTISLMESQVKSLIDKGIDAAYIGPGPCAKESFKRLMSNVGKEDFPILVYCTPEYLMGVDGKTGAARSLLKISHQLALIVIDECHMIFQRSGEFRKSFTELVGLHELFPNVPLMALTATLPAEQSEELITHYLKNPVVIKSTVNRPNIKLYVGEYDFKTEKTPSSKKELAASASGNMATDEDELGEEEQGVNVTSEGLKASKPSDKTASPSKWKKVLEKVVNMADGQYSIIFMDFVANVKEAHNCMVEELKQTCLKYHGKGMKENEKLEIMSKFRNHECQFLIASEAYQVGTHDDHVNLVCRVGCPRTLTGWTQEFGRAGRSGGDAKGIIYCNEFRDDQRLVTWLKGVDMKEKEDIKSNYAVSWRFIYCKLTGECMRAFLTASFGEDPDGPLEYNKSCCESCDLSTDLVYNVKNDFLLLLEVIRELQENTSEKQILNWLRGSGTSSMKDVEMKVNSLESNTYGKGLQKSNAVWSKILRQAVGKGYVDIIFTENRFKGCPRIYRKYKVSNNGHQFLENPAEVFLKNPCDVVASNKSRRSESKCRGKQYMPIIRSALASKNNWEKMSSEDDYVYPGYGKSPEKFVFCEDVSKFYNKSDTIDIFTKDCELSSSQSHTSPQIIEIDGLKTEVVVRRSVCAGVKVCGASDCNYTVSTAQRINRCKSHSNSHGLQKSSQCPVNIVNIWPKKRDDRRRWIGILTLGETVPRHNHGKPSPRKLPSSLVNDLKCAVLLDPSKKAKELQKGNGMPYIPVEKSIVAANLDKIRRVRNLAFKSTGSTDGEIHLMSMIINFEKEIQRVVDQPEKVSDESTNADMVQNIRTLSLPYPMKGTPYIFSESFRAAFFMNPNQSRLFASAEHLNVDLTFTGNGYMPYLINVVTFDLETLEWTPVARCLLNKQSGEAHGRVFREMFAAVNEQHNDFNNGQNIEGITVDFSDAEANGLEEPLGSQMASKVLRGCKVHWSRSYQRISHRVCKGKTEIAIFQHLASKIESLTRKEDVLKVFKVLAGEDKVSNAIRFITAPKFQTIAEELNNTNWKKAKAWKEWWTRERHLRMFTAAFTLMDEGQWEACTSTTNPVESINRESVPKDGRQKSLSEVLTHLYRIDKIYAAKKVAASNNVTTTYRDQSPSSQEKRRERKRNWRRRSEVTAADDDPQGPPDSGKNKRRKTGKGNGSLLNRRVNVETADANGNWEGWFVGTIVNFDKINMEYTISFDGFDKSHNIVVPEDEIPSEDIELL